MGKWLRKLNVLNNGSSKKKVNCDLDHVETRGFLHGVQHVPKNTFEVFSDIANFRPFLLYFMGIFEKKFLKLLKMEQN